MIAFRPVTLADRALIERFVWRSEQQNCDLAFANIFCWQELYRSEVAEFEEQLFFRLRVDGDAELGYMVLPSEEISPATVELLRQDAALHRQPLRLVGLREDDCAHLEQCCPQQFAFDRSRSMSDYIYRREDLARLSGKHYQPKRNHINRFRALYPNHRFERLTPAHIEECIRLEQCWCQHTDRCREAAIVAERKAMLRAFSHFEELGLEGGVLYVEDQMVAFSYGSRVNPTTFVVHVEKADTNYEGAFTMINRLLVESLDEPILWINREEDLGIEGLRKAKRSYHPDHLVDKYRAEWLSEEQQACRRLWQEAFPDDDRCMIDRFLVRYYKRERLFLKRKGDAIVAMAHLVPFATEQGMVGYLYAIATTATARGEGIAASLIDEAAVEAHRRGFAALALIPAEEGLRSYYAKLGFTGDFPIQLMTPDHFDFGTGEAANDRAMWRSLDGLITPPDGLLQCRYIK